MALELQRPRVTVVQVRMDCNGCVQRIKKTLNNIDGINDIYFDLPQQKITIIGWAEPEYIIQAIRRTKRNATIICSPYNVEPTQSPSQRPEQAPDNATQKQQEDGPPEKLQAEPRKEPPPPPPEQPPEAAALPKLTEDSSSQQSESCPESEDEAEVHEIYQHPPNYGSRYASCDECVGPRDKYHREAFLQEPQTPIYVTHRYNTCQAPPYVTEYEYVKSYQQHTHYSRMKHYSGEYYNENESFASMFSDENPNSCTIV